MCLLTDQPTARTRHLIRCVVESLWFETGRCLVWMVARFFVKCVIIASHHVGYSFGAIKYEYNNRRRL